jgi:hypothetical protein
MRTIAYVDGYNLYYGCLKHTPHKWLDLFALLEGILRIQDPSSSLELVKYFTAPIKTKLASQGQAAGQAQADYHRALEARGKVEIHKGWHSLEHTHALRYEKDVPPSKATRVPIWRLEEKETDVGLALHLYSDALHRRCEQVVLVSSDTDLRLALSLLKRDAPHIRRGLIYPRSEDAGRPSNLALAAEADWIRREIKAAELASSHLPNRVPTRKRPILKPAYW